MRVIAIANQKGGCGKTTTSINFSAGLAGFGKKTLLIDMDPQGHSTCGLGIPAANLSYTLYDLLCAGPDLHPKIANVMREIQPYFYVLPATTNLAGLEEEFLYLVDRNQRLKNHLLPPLDHEHLFDYVILDCPPNLGVLTLNALFAADEIIIPIEPSFFSLHGLAKITETIENINDTRRRPLRIHALLTIFDSETCFAKEIYEDVRQHFTDRLFRTIIHEHILLKESAGAGQSIMDYAPDSAPAREYGSLAKEFMEREWDHAMLGRKLASDGGGYAPVHLPGGILFQYFRPGARMIEIVGDFNRWVPEPLVPRSPEGLWQKVVCSVPGMKAVRYKFIVDGQWRVDPSNAARAENAYGSQDSYLEIA